MAGRLGPSCSSFWCLSYSAALADSVVVPSTGPVITAAGAISLYSLLCQSWYALLSNSDVMLSRSKRHSGPIGDIPPAV